MHKIVSERVVNVSVPTEALYDVKKMRKITDSLLGKLGCPACHSGFDLRFRELRDFVVNPQTLEVQEHYQFR